MRQRYCEVALPVPLRSTFSYAIPASLNGEELIGRRVVVPFRNRAMVGVCLAISDRAPNIPRIKELAEVMDLLPALPEKLIELGHWISRYYLAPVGETFRALLPPEVELRPDREYWITEAGRANLQQLGSTLRRRKLSLSFYATSMDRRSPCPLCKFAGAPGENPWPKNWFGAECSERPKCCANVARAHRKSWRGIPQTQSRLQTLPKKRSAIC
jgi:primosomal protein N'